MVRYTAVQIGQVVRQTRQRLGLTQAELALAAGTGLRFIIELEKGKPTCELEKVLSILNTLGVKITLEPPIPFGDGRVADRRRSD